MYIHSSLRFPKNLWVRVNMYFVVSILFTINKLLCCSFWPTLILFLLSALTCLHKSMTFWWLCNGLGQCMYVDRFAGHIAVLSFSARVNSKVQWSTELPILCGLFIRMTVLGSDIILYHTVGIDASLTYLVSQGLAYLLYPMLMSTLPDTCFFNFLLSVWCCLWFSRSL